MSGTVNDRELVLDLLVDIVEKGMFSHVSINNMLKKYQYLDKTERAFITRLTEGTIENLILLDYIIDQFSSVKVKKMKPLIRNILRMSVYQFLYMDSVPNAAACNEAVKLATKRGFGQLKGFVNGVLRNINRNLEEIKYPDASKDLPTYLSIVYSIPLWIIEQWIFQYGVEYASRMAKATLEHDFRITVRCNTKDFSVEQITKKLEDEGVEVQSTPYNENGLYLSGIDYIGKLNAFKDGLISVQDFSSMLVAYIAEPKENDYCIDMCAAPGGKSIHLAELMKGTGTVEARDISENKISLIESNINRVGVTNVIPLVKDAFLLDEDMIEKADIVIADLPCSGLGVIGKKSDIKYNMTKDKQDELVRIQRCILENAVKYIKKGGYLVFSTCTTNKQENEENFKWLIEKFGLRPVDISEKIPKNIVDTDTAKDGYVQLLMGVHQTDGFFISKFQIL